jgi:hypothetical protein
MQSSKLRWNAGAEPNSLPYSISGRKYLTMIPDYRDIFVTANRSKCFRLNLLLQYVAQGRAFSIFLQNGVWVAQPIPLQIRKSLSRHPTNRSIRVGLFLSIPDYDRRAGAVAGCAASIAATLQ